MRKTRELHKSLDCKRFRSRELKSNTKNPIVFAQDVTGSMGNWAKVIYDKLPMLYGQIMMNGYLPEPSLCFAGIGDAYCDKAPFQVTDFGQGKQIDQMISKMYLESGGGGQDFETYELGAYWFNRKCNISNAETPFFFFTGDENYYPNVRKSHISDVLGMSEEKDMDSVKEFQNLKKKFKGNVFLLHKIFKDGNLTEDEVVQCWSKAIGKENIIVLTDAKAVVDVMLGVICIASGKRTLDGYIKDMKGRNQTKDRIELVKKALEPMSKNFSVFKSTREVKKIKTESFGIIPVRFKNGKCEVCIAKHKNGGHWDFIKGRPEADNGKATAERELKEEVNLRIVKYLSDDVFKTHYKIDKWEGYLIEKTVSWWVAECDGELKIQEEEMLDAAWVPMEEVNNKLTYEDSKELFKKVVPLLS